MDYYLNDNYFGTTLLEDITSCWITSQKHRFSVPKWLKYSGSTFSLDQNQQLIKHSIQKAKLWFVVNYCEELAFSQWESIAQWKNQYYKRIDGLAD